MKFVSMYEPLIIKAQKNSPPHIAFEEVLELEPATNKWVQIEKIKPIELIVQKNTAPLFARKIDLPEMILKKSVEPIFTPDSEEHLASNNDSGSWIDELPRSESIRLREAQKRSDVLEQDWDIPSWSEMAKTALEKSGALTLNNAPRSSVYIAGTNSAGKVQNQIPRSKVLIPTGTLDASDPSAQSFVEEQSSIHSIVGPLEITGGLGITNEHHIEIRRSDEGILKELGRADLKQGLYNIDVENTSGTVVAHLVDKQGKILGEGSFRLSRLVTGPSKQKSLQGPMLKIAPRPDYSGIILSAYSSKVTDGAPAKTRVTFIKGASEIEVKKDGIAVMDNVTKGSTTVMRAAAPNYLQTASIIVSGQEFKSQLFPSKMIQALEDIVAQQRMLSFDGSPSIIWGKVSLDGKSLAGIEVVVESDSTLQPIYFNALMLPDAALKATSENGLFAFVDVSPGFHSLLATRQNSIVGYQNVVVEEGSIAQGDIESTIKSDVVPLRVFDAFGGEAHSATVTMQSLQDDIEFKKDVVTVNLPHVNRLGMIRVQPQQNEYALAHYFYNDTDAYIHLPLIKWTWLSAVKNYLRIDDHPSVGMIVGFVPDEDFEVYLAGYEKFDQHSIVYFDMQGKILSNRKGMAGGGFILYNVPEDTHEVVVIGNRTQKIYSRVLPVDANSLSVLNFQE
ncbi:MAG: hypothetical protein ACXVCY_06790 [Pseudobdellovibrionaceae bacterium]